jgi:hypothetical protein
LYTRPTPKDEFPFVTGENPYYDEVLRLGQAGEPDVPVGIVSKSYKLVQHRELFETTVKALREAGAAWHYDFCCPRDSALTHATTIRCV